MENSMKPTSIEWIGDIPSDWVVKKADVLLERFMELEKSITGKVKGLGE
jgi:hypothetical protein